MIRDCIKKGDVVQLVELSQDRRVETELNEKLNLCVLSVVLGRDTCFSDFTESAIFYYLSEMEKKKGEIEESKVESKKREQSVRTRLVEESVVEQAMRGMIDMKLISKCQPKIVIDTLLARKFSLKNSTRYLLTNFLPKTSIFIEQVIGLIRLKNPTISRLAISRLRLRCPDEIKDLLDAVMRSNNPKGLISAVEGRIDHNSEYIEIFDAYYGKN
jgi:hypothetical protein